MIQKNSRNYITPSFRNGTRLLYNVAIENEHWSTKAYHVSKQFFFVQKAILLIKQYDIIITSEVQLLKFLLCSFKNTEHDINTTEHDILAYIWFTPIWYSFPWGVTVTFGPISAVGIVPNTGTMPLGPSWEVYLMTTGKRVVGNNTFRNWITFYPR